MFKRIDIHRVTLTIVMVTGLLLGGCAVKEGQGIDDGSVTVEDSNKGQGIQATIEDLAEEAANETGEEEVDTTQKLREESKTPPEEDGVMIEDNHAYIIQSLEPENEGEAWRYGLVDELGQLVIDYEYDYLTYIEGTSLIRGTKGDGVYLIDVQSLEAVGPYNWEELDLVTGELTYGLGPRVYYDEATGKYGYWDGKIYMTLPNYTQAYEFNDGFAVVTMEDSYEPMYHVIDEAYEVVLSHESRIIGYGHGIFGLVQDYAYYNDRFNRVKLVNDQGVLLSQDSFYDVIVMDEQRLLVSDHIEYRFIDYEGKALSDYGIPLGVYKEAEVFNEQIYLYRDPYVSDEVMIIDMEGAMIYDGMDHTPSGLTSLGDDIYIEHHLVISERFREVTIPRLTIGGDESYFAEVNGEINEVYGADNYEALTIEEVYMEEALSFDVNRVGDVAELNFNSYWYGFGAAHPNHWQATMHVDLLTGNAYDLDDLIIDDVAYQSLTNKVRAMAQEEPEMYFNIDEIYVGSETEYQVTEDGIIVYYVPYEIAPYAAGYPRFFIGFSELEGLIDKESAYWQSLMAKSQ